LKPPSAVIGPGETIRRPAWAGRIDHEAEMGIVIGRAAHDLPSAEAARGHVLGAVCVNDVTARELQDRDVQFTRAKGFDTFCPVGPCIATGLDLGRLAA
jgi:2-keto-4-pentenoate hydratase/2-oxohepta-3-ene-1,7-dioic acid hydratase in catechol pathway